MESGETAAVADALAKRRDLLAALCEGPTRKPALVETLGLPRTTLDRGVRELVDAGLAERADGGVRATGLGREALAARDEYRDRLDGLVRAAALFEPLPTETSLDRRFLAGAEVSRPEPSAPDRVVARLLESVRNADEVRGVAPVALAGHLEPFDRAATAGGTVPELVVTPDVLDHLVEVRGERFRESLRDGDLAFYRAAVDVPFGVWIADGDDESAEAGVVVYTDTGVGGVAVNGRPEAVSWARERYGAAREEAEPVTADRVARRLDGRSAEDATGG